jgi:hypothetical protein
MAIAEHKEVGREQIVIESLFDKHRKISMDFRKSVFPHAR